MAEKEIIPLKEENATMVNATELYKVEILELKSQIDLLKESAAKNVVIQAKTVSVEVKDFSA